MEFTVKLELTKEELEIVKDKLGYTDLEGVDAAIMTIWTQGLVAAAVEWFRDGLDKEEESSETT